MHFKLSINKLPHTRDFLFSIISYRRGYHLNQFQNIYEEIPAFNKNSIQNRRNEDDDNPTKLIINNLQTSLSWPQRKLGAPFYSV